MTDFINNTNPEAGFLPESPDPREAEDCFRPSNRSLRTLPYSLMRFGDCGKRFTYTDSGFIVNLVTRPAHIFIGEILWLGKMLANRGIPPYLLERHLEFLFEELVFNIPEKRTEFSKLKNASEYLGIM